METCTWQQHDIFSVISLFVNSAAAAAAMATVAPPITFLLLLLQLADGSFPEEPSPLSYVPVEGTCPFHCSCVGVGVGVCTCAQQGMCSVDE